MSGRSPLIVLICSIAAVIAIVCGLTWLATAGAALLPVVFGDSRYVTNRGALMVLTVLLLSLYALALALLWARRRSVLDLWLMVMCCTWLLFLVTSNFLSRDRFTVGWYGARGHEVIAVMVVLVALLSETTALYAKLARTVVRERGAREARQVAMDVMAAAIGHELKQPLAAIANDGYAGLRWIAKPDLDEARASFEGVISSAHRASEVIDGIRSLFKQENRGRASLDVNDLVRVVLTVLDVDLQMQRVSVSTGLRDSLPQLLANRAQMKEVFINLIMNAIEAMHSNINRERLLRITSDISQGSLTVLVTIEDTGMGIDSKDIYRIFEPFFTTKSKGTGIGLAICRAVVESHGGSLHASANDPFGTIFYVALPSGNLL
jgi:signal transduction histidine kinase